MRTKISLLTLFLSLGLFMLFLGASPALAGPADTLNGSWAVDVEATVAAKSKKRGIQYSKEDIEAAKKERGARLQMTFDIEKKEAVSRIDGSDRVQKDAIKKVTEKGNQVTLLLGEEETSFLIQSQDTMMMEYGPIVFRRMKK